MYGPPHWDWKKQNEVQPENVDAYLYHFRKDNPNMAYRASVKKPSGAANSSESINNIRAGLHL
jgi:hypothetical protein